MVHGGGTPIPLIQKIRKAVVAARRDVNVIGINWYAFQIRNNKFDIHNCSKMFGKIIGDFLKSMEKNNGLSFDKLTIVGHSIGGGFSADIGYNINSQAKSIVGLETCSYKNAAKFVEVRT